MMLSDMDINAIAGTLKLYFRELPEPLLTDRLYPAFMEGIGVWPLVPTVCVCVCHQWVLLEFYKGVKVTPPWRDEGQWVKDLSCHNLIWHLFPLSHSALRSSSQGELHDAPPALPARPQPHDLSHSTGAPQTVKTHHPSGKNNQNPYIAQIPKKLGCRQIECENSFTKCSWALSWAVVISCKQSCVLQSFLGAFHNSPSLLFAYVLTC